VRIDMDKRADEQVDAVLEAIRAIIPIKFEKIRIAIKVPPQYAGRAVGMIRNFGTPSKEEYGADGSYLCVIEVAAGIQAEIYDKFNSLTHGEVQVKKMDK